MHSARSPHTADLHSHWFGELQRSVHVLPRVLTQADTFCAAYTVVATSEWLVDLVIKWLQYMLAGAYEACGHQVQSRCYSTAEERNLHAVSSHRTGTVTHQPEPCSRSSPVASWGGASRRRGGLERRPRGGVLISKRCLLSLSAGKSPPRGRRAPRGQMSARAVI